MKTKERILMIRLAQKLEKYPAFAEALGIEATGAIRKTDTDPKGLTTS